MLPDLDVLFDETTVPSYRGGARRASGEGPDMAGTDVTSSWEIHGLRGAASRRIREGQLPGQNMVRLSNLTRSPWTRG